VAPRDLIEPNTSEETDEEEDLSDEDKERLF